MWFMVGGAVGYQATETVNLQLVGVFFEFDEAAETVDDFTGFKLEGKAVWTPVDNLDLGIAGQFVSITEETDDLDDNDEGNTVDDLRVELRAQRSF